MEEAWEPTERKKRRDGGVLKKEVLAGGRKEKKEAAALKEKKMFPCSKHDRNTPVEQTFTVKDEKQRLNHFSWSPESVRPNWLHVCVKWRSKENRIIQQHREKVAVFLSSQPEV